jgi:hypothetical protein
MALTNMSRLGYYSSTVLLSVTGLWAQIAPHTHLQANLGPVPIDKYLSTNYDTIYGHGFVPDCNTSQTVRACYQQILASFHQQGVEGVRFMFYFCGGAYSTALNGCGAYNGTSLNPAWASNMQTFLQDVAAAGITEVTPTPQWGYGYDTNIPYCTDGTYTCGAEDGNYNWYKNSLEPSLNDGVVWQRVTDTCSSTGSTVSLFFWPGLPFGVRSQNTLGDPPGSWKGFYNNSYNCSPKNPYFAGWQNIYNTFSSMLSSAKTAGLTIHEFDIENENDELESTVELRFMSDNMHTDTGNGNVFDVINYYLNYYGLGTTNLSWSVGEYRTSVDQYDCASVYGDSARILRLSSLLAAMNGAAVGWPTGLSQSNGLNCGGSVASDWVAQPRGYPLPTIIDFHQYDILSANNVAVSFNDYKAFLDAWGPAGGYWHGNVPALYNAEVMLGETHSNQINYSTNQSCEGIPNPSQLPGYEINGFNMSGLANSSRITVFRPWEYFIYWDPTYGGCYPVPAVINPPYSATQ